MMSRDLTLSQFEHTAFTHLLTVVSKSYLYFKQHFGLVAFAAHLNKPPC